MLVSVGFCRQPVRFWVARYKEMISTRRLDSRVSYSVSESRAKMGHRRHHVGDLRFAICLPPKFIQSDIVTEKEFTVEDCATALYHKYVSYKAKLQVCAFS